MNNLVGITGVRYSVIRNYAKRVIIETNELKKVKPPVRVEYQVFKPSNRKLDRLNVVSVAAKITLDTLTEAEVWDDDNDDIVVNEVLLPTQLDRQNPRIEIKIIPVDPKLADALKSGCLPLFRFLERTPGPTLLHNL